MGCTLAQPNGSERPEEPFENRSDRSIVELFEDIARKNPTSVSVIQPSADGNDGPKVTLKTITYEALAFQKNAVCARLVQSLRDAEAPDEATIVPVYVHSLSCYKIPVFLGILQAGHSFTVLAAEWGPKRIEDVLASCSCHVMICIGSAVPDFPGRSDHKVLHVDDRFFCQTIAENTPSNSTRRTCESPMAIMFTSGTTGRPKGVVIPDRAVIRLADGHLLPGGNEMVFLHHSPASFDASLLEIFPPLLNGGRVADFLQKSTELSAMEDFMKLAGTTHAFFTTSLYNHIIDHYPSIFAETPSLRRVYSGGESMSLSHMRRAFEQLKHLPDLKLVNVYGPTETGVLSTSVEITESLLSLQENNIGKSISCTQIYVLKQDCCVEACANPKELLCKNGEVGELYVGGRGVCDYLPNAPTSIEPKFLPSPFDPSSRLYRTGDLARQKGDGSIIFVGRKDRQLKLRGQRIEPAEVERVISEVAGIKQCHVLKHNENLVVCYTGQLAKGVEEITTELREQTSWLPAAVPHIWLPFENFQLTANGKLDEKWLRKRLNDRVLGQPPSENAEHSRTRTCAWRISWKISRILKDMSPEAGEAPDEKKLREIGFNSLRVMVLQKKLRDAFGVSLELQQLTNGRAGDLLSAILAALELNAAAAPGPAQPVPAPPQLGGRSESSVQQENLLKEWETAAEEMKTKQNEFVCLHLKGPLDETALTKACQQLCERHEPFRTHFEVQDGKVYQVVEPRKMTMLWKELPDELNDKRLWLRNGKSHSI